MKHLVVILVLIMHSAAFAEYDWREFIFPRQTYQTPLYTPAPASWLSESSYDEEDYTDNYDSSYDEPNDYGYDYSESKSKYIYPDLVITICDYNGSNELYCYDL